MNAITINIINYMLLFVGFIVIAYLIFVIVGQSSTSLIEVSDGKRKFVLDVKSRNGSLDAVDMINKIMSNRESGEIFFALLANRGIYKYDDPLLVDTIKVLPPDHTVSLKLRYLSENDIGPFRHTLYKASLGVAQYIVPADTAAVCPSTLFGKYIIVNNRGRMIKVQATKRATGCDYDDPTPELPIRLLINPEKAAELELNSADTIYASVTCSDYIPTVPK